MGVYREQFVTVRDQAGGRVTVKLALESPYRQRSNRLRRRLLRELDRTPTAYASALTRWRLAGELPRWAAATGVLLSLAGLLGAVLASIVVIAMVVA